MWVAVLVWDQRDFDRLVPGLNHECARTLQLDFRMAPGRDAPVLNLRPGSLLLALWLQLGQAVADETEFRRCNECPTWFAYGNGAGKKRSALYCSDRCRQAGYRRRQRA